MKGGFVVKLAEVKAVLEKSGLLLSTANYYGNEELELDFVSVDTRSIVPGTLFICRKGVKFDSHALVAEALQLGAKALIVEKPVDVEQVPILLVSDSRYAEAVISSAFYGFPHEQMKVYGVTGTNGKTTISTLIHYILTRKGRKGSLLGTVKNIIVDRYYDSENTTPSALEVLKDTRETLAKGGEFLSMEVSSHALVMKRVEAIRFDYAILTNITQDHLDFHKTMGDYANAKFHLFELLKPEGKAILNMDDEWISTIAQRLPLNRTIITYGMYNKEKMPDYASRNPKVSIDGLSFELWVKGVHQGNVESQLIAEYNVYNLLSVVALLHRDGIPLEEILTLIKEFRGVEGRFELYPHIGNDIDLVIDFAHTPDALEKTLDTAKALTRNRLIVVFGAGGDADQTKRPIMGQVVAERGDVLIITTDNPKSEKAFDIIRQIEAGIQSDVPYLLVEDRKMAIETAINIASKGDMIILAGKGHEHYQIFDHAYLPFSDREIAFQMIRTLKKSAS
jgi:UDP-N-acetylmuramoyl-L-alanyl-D-glutamate--2,6-diaminopimelate ligase